MKRYLITAFAAFALCSASAQVSMPQASPTEMIRQDFGMGRIELTYSRPAVKGRAVFKENSELAPLGKMWRTGANAATKVRFTDKVTIGGKSLDSGTYVLYTIPQKNEWEVIFNKGLSNWGTDGYKESEDVVRLKVPVTKTNHVENFTMNVGNIQPESCELELAWATASVKVPVTTNIKDRLRAQIQDALKGEKKPFQQAATFFYEWDKDYAKALDNVNKGIEGNPKAFWLYLLKAKIQKDMGDKPGAKESANKTIEVATAAKNDDYVRQANELLKKI